METMDNEILQALSARKSVRVYTDEPVTEAERDAILQAAFQAPTAGNQQLYTILNITDPALKARLADLCDHQPFIAKAPLVLVFLADCRRWLQAYKAAGIEDVRTPGVGDLLLAMADTCIAAQNAVVAAESMGIGSCYIGDVIENAEQMREACACQSTWSRPACWYLAARRTSRRSAPNRPGLQRTPSFVRTPIATAPTTNCAPTSPPALPPTASRTTISPPPSRPSANASTRAISPGK